MLDISTAGQVAHERLSLLVFNTGPFEDDTPLFGQDVPSGPESFVERASKVKMKGSVRFNIAFTKPDTEFGLGIEDVIDAMGTRVFEIAKRINTEIFKS